MSLYLAHFGLREPPFRITPHTDFFFSGANRGPTLEALIYAITQDEGIVKVSGEVGSGKTMLCRMLLEKLPEDVETIYLANPSLSRQEIVAAIADELGIPADGRSTHSLTRALQDALVQRYGAGKRVVVLIDEAHAMPAESLEEIRLLSNLESKSAKLLQIALFAQPELDERLAASDMRQLRERVTQHFNLAPLKPGDVAAYIEFRLRAAGYRGPNPFADEAVSEIARASEGLSRRINILADKALLAAFSAGSHAVDSEAVRIAIQDARFAPLHGTASTGRWPWPAVLAGAIALATVLVGVGLWLGTHQPASPPFAIIAEPSPAPTTTAPAVRPDPQPAVAPVPVAQSAESASSPPAAHPSASLSGPYADRFAKWIAQADPRHYFIQLAATDPAGKGEIERLLKRLAPLVDAEQMRSYSSNLSGRERIGIVYGEFDTRMAALAAIATLPDEARALQPYPRQVSRLRQ